MVLSPSIERTSVQTGVSWRGAERTSFPKLKRNQAGVINRKLNASVGQASGWPEFVHHPFPPTTCGVWPILRSSSRTASTRPGRTRSTRSDNRPATSAASFLRASNSSASTASSVKTRHTRRCSFADRRAVGLFTVFFLLHSFDFFLFSDCFPPRRADLLPLDYGSPMKLHYSKTYSASSWTNLTGILSNPSFSNTLIPSRMTRSAKGPNSFRLSLAKSYACKTGNLSNLGG
jgi:hypothetical protein